MGRNDEQPIGGERDRLTWWKRWEEEKLGDALLRNPHSFEAIFVGRIRDLFPKIEYPHTLDRPILEPLSIRLEPTLWKRKQKREL